MRQRHRDLNHPLGTGQTAKTEEQARETGRREPRKSTKTPSRRASFKRRGKK